MDCPVYKRSNYGGFWRRYFGNAVDGLLLGGIYAGIGAFVEEVSPVLMLALGFAYVVGFRGFTGATLGYRVCRIRIIAITGADVGVRQILVRLVASVFSHLALGLGQLWLVFDRHKQTWHDKIAGTYVIKTRAQPIGTIERRQKRLMRPGLFVICALVGSAFLVGIVGAVGYVLTNSESYRVSIEYITENQWVQEQVGGNLTVGVWPEGYVDGRDAEYRIDVWGDEAEITVYIRSENRGDGWVIVEAGYGDEQEEFVDITRPHPSEAGPTEQLPEPDPPPDRPPPI